MNQNRTNRKLAAIFSTDVVGYSRMMEADEAWTIQNLEENKRLMSSLIEEYKGRVVDSPGDNLLAEFSSVINAVECAVKIQKELNRKNSRLTEEHQMKFRIGVNLGDVVEEDGKIYGNGVNIAARLEALAEPGGICISRTAHDQVKSKIDVDYDYLGEYHVKNINEPVRVYRILMGGESTEKYVPHAEGKRRVISLNVAIVALIIFLVVAVGMTVVIMYPKPTKPPQVVTFYHELSEGQKINTYGNSIAVSPDSSQFVFCTTDGLYLRPINELKARLLSETNDRPCKPVFSPDSRWVAYWSESDGKIKKVAISGGSPVPLLNATVTGSLTWNTDNTFMYAEGNTVFRIPANSENPEQFIKIEKALIGNLQLLPDGKTIIFSNHIKDPSSTMLYSLESGKSEILFEGAFARYLQTGHIIYDVGSTVYAIPFDIDTLKVTGRKVILFDNAMNFQESYPQYAASDTGTLVYVSAPEGITVEKKSELVWVDRGGNEEVLAVEPNDYRSVKISPDGKKVALTIKDATSNDIWIWDFTPEPPKKLTFDSEAEDDFPLWTVDGKRIIFMSARGGTNGRLYWKAANGTGKAELIKDKVLLPSSLSVDGEILALIDVTEVFPKISTLSMKEGGGIKSLFITEQVVTQPKISPDGRWLAYMANTGGKPFKLYVSPFPVVEAGKWEIDKLGGGYLPLWSPHGHELFYRKRDKVIAVSVKADETFNFGKPEVLFEDKYYPYNRRPIDTTTWDIHPDSKRFLMIKPMITIDNISYKIIVVTNFLEELKEKVPVD